MAFRVWGVVNAIENRYSHDLISLGGTSRQDSDTFQSIPLAMTVLVFHRGRHITESYIFFNKRY